MSSQQIAIAQMLSLKLHGVNLANFNDAIQKLADALLYLVQNTPEVRK